MKPISTFRIAVGLLIAPIAGVSAEESPPSCDCECPSLEAQVEERLSEYKEKLDAEVKRLKDTLNDQINKQRIDELQENLQQLFDDMLEDFKKDDATKPKEIRI